MNGLEIKRMEVEILRVQAARAELEFKIIEREYEIQRMRDHIKIQMDRESELKNKLEEINRSK